MLSPGFLRGLFLRFLLLASATGGFVSRLLLGRFAIATFVCFPLRLGGPFRGLLRLALRLFERKAFGFLAFETGSDLGLLAASCASRSRRARSSSSACARRSAASRSSASLRGFVALVLRGRGALTLGSRHLLLCLPPSFLFLPLLGFERFSFAAIVFGFLAALAFLGPPDLFDPCSLRLLGRPFGGSLLVFLATALLRFVGLAAPLVALLAAPFLLDAAPLELVLLGQELGFAQRPSRRGRASADQTQARHRRPTVALRVRHPQQPDDRADAENQEHQAPDGGPRKRQEERDNDDRAERRYRLLLARHRWSPPIRHPPDHGHRPVHVTPTIGALPRPGRSSLRAMPEPLAVRTWHREGYTITTDPAQLDIGLIHDFLSHQSYWAAGVPLDVVKRTIDHSLNFGVFDSAGAQVAFARVVTDFGVIAYLADVFVVPGHQGRGLGTWLLSVVVGQPELQHLRRFSLATRDAHDFYARFGFVPHPHPADVLEIRHSVHELYGPSASSDASRADQDK